jgi:hypothetical protein
VEVLGDIGDPRGVIPVDSYGRATKQRSWQIRTADDYASRLTSEGVTIAVEPLFRDELAAVVFDKNDIVTRGIIPLAVVIFNGNDFRHGRPEKTRITPEAPSAQGFAWLWRNLHDNNKLNEQVEIHHEGKCCRCGRKLTVPRSIELGIGPECEGKM